MFSPKELRRSCFCSDLRQHRPHAILFNILNRKDGRAPGDDHWSYSDAHRCHCEQQKLVCLTSPEVTCPVASAVLLKTVHFMKSLPSFQQLPCRDQLSLLRSCWAPLFVLGLAQERTPFEVTDVPAGSILRKILLNDHNRDSGGAADSPPTLAAVHNLKSCLNKFWSLDLSPKEYAYLKGTVLFNPDVCSLLSCEMIEGLQQEAQWALQELVHTLHPDDPGRFSLILLTASALHTVAQSFITELFFRPVIGRTDLHELLTEILLS
ncbi:nuclear receptor subfamily 0, group B, member 2b [Colossoma macropomum]|uniref:nuclear receptor subfamily 0, group B, member 2b n=1 Tax=Colossoma macropomum TaxID=42526 RepID=UPI001863F179|nr:nuclear receptor subfamily 0, group B, member 2b [Colossoma macropomum]